MSTLSERIEKLNREQVIEAAQFLSRSLTEGQKAGEAENAALAQLKARPFKYLGEVEQLARIILLAAAANPEYEEEVEKALAGTGHKQIILGGMEIVALAGIGLVALHVIVTRGKSKENLETEIISPDGTKVKTSKTTSYGISSSLGDILKNYFGGLGGK
jgi:hypothetical protein